MKALGNALAALCLFASGAAAAQEAPAPVAVWTDPSARFTLDFVANGFTPVAAPSNANLAIEVEHAAFQRSASAARVCGVLETRVPRVLSTNQGDANARLYARTEQELAAALRGRVSELGRARVGGISLLSFRLDTGALQQYGRMFYLARDGGVFQVTVTCGGPAPLTMLEVTTMNRTLETLSFLPEASQ